MAKVNIAWAVLCKSAEIDASGDITLGILGFLVLKNIPCRSHDPFALAFRYDCEPHTSFTLDASIVAPSGKTQMWRNCTNNISPPRWHGHVYVVTRFKDWIVQESGLHKVEVHARSKEFVVSAPLTVLSDAEFSLLTAKESGLPMI